MSDGLSITITICATILLLRIIGLIVKNDK